jgi:hypothetical protein
MAFLKFRAKDTIIMSLCTALILLPYLILMHAPSLVTIQNALANRFNKSTGGKIDLVKAVVPAYDWVNITAIDEEYPGLRQMLRDTALPNNTILLTALNSAWAEEHSMIDLFLRSFHNGENISHYLDHLLIICLIKQVLKDAKQSIILVLG